MSDIYPRKVRIITTRGLYGHNFENGSIVTLESGQLDYFCARGYCYDRANEDGQNIHAEDFEEIKEEGGVEKEVAKRPKLMYTVQYEDGRIICSTRDRTFAREVKADFGGKAKGIVIMQYVEVKEIR